MRVVGLVGSQAVRAFAWPAEPEPRHRWQQGGLVVWDNLATLHTASPCDSSRHRRLLYRAAVICSSGSLAEPARPSRRLRTTASAFRPTSLLH
ncbi:TauD/TfdA family dioxygenase [Streptomyces sp. NPDC056524]|uniref:TauD/TfdA family dioxygenase n=1 Tax=Streptomyces sp. NPDC056524 TaxID=3345851 RepID=UPI0036A71226